MPKNFKKEVNKRRKNNDKPATKRVNATEDIENENDKSSENIEMGFINEGEINEYLVVPDKAKVTKNIWNTIYEVVNDKYFRQSYVMFLKDFLSEFKKHFNELHFIPVKAKNRFNRFVLSTGFYPCLLILNIYSLNNYKSLQ